MAWDEESVLKAADTVEFEGSLWILHLAGNTEVGIGKTSDYHTQEGSVRSYAKDQGLEDPGVQKVRIGYQNLCRKSVTDAMGNSGSILRQDKPDIVRLTSLGKDLMRTINSDRRIENSVKQSIGVETDAPPEPWWPGNGPQDSFEVFLHTYADRSVLDESHATIEAQAEFECTCCGETVESNFELTLEDGIMVEAWGRKIQTQCENCMVEFQYSAANPHEKPDPVE